MLEQQQCACGTGFFTARKNVTQCRRCRRGSRWQNAGQRRREREIAALGDHTTADFLTIIRAQNYVCFWCCAPLREESGKIVATRDHLVPISRRGSNCKSNIAAACLPCNQAKGGMTATEYHIFLKARVHRFSEFSGVPAYTEGVDFEEKQRPLSIQNLPAELQETFRRLLSRRAMNTAPDYKATRVALKTQARELLKTEPQTLVFLGMDVDRKAARRQELKAQIEQWRSRA